MIYAALKRMSGVTTLTLSFSWLTPHSYLTGLTRCSFPNLRSLKIELEITPSVLTFICCNRCSIRYLYINPHGDAYQFMTPVCAFPKLEFYHGARRFMSAFLPGSPVRIVYGFLCYRRRERYYYHGGHGLYFQRFAHDRCTC